MSSSPVGSPNPLNHHYINTETPRDSYFFVLGDDVSVGHSSPPASPQAQAAEPVEENQNVFTRVGNQINACAQCVQRLGATFSHSIAPAALAYGLAILPNEEMSNGDRIIRGLEFAVSSMVIGTLCLGVMKSVPASRSWFNVIRGDNPELAPANAFHEALDLEAGMQARNPANIPDLPPPYRPNNLVSVSYAHMAPKFADRLRQFETRHRNWNFALKAITCPPKLALQASLGIIQKIACKIEGGAQFNGFVYSKLPEGVLQALEGASLFIATQFLGVNTTPLQKFYASLILSQTFTLLRHAQVYRTRPNNLPENPTNEDLQQAKEDMHKTAVAELPPYPTAIQPFLRPEWSESPVGFIRRAKQIIEQAIYLPLACPEDLMATINQISRNHPFLSHLAGMYGLQYVPEVWKNTSGTLQLYATAAALHLSTNLIFNAHIANTDFGPYHRYLHALLNCASAPERPEPEELQP